MAASGSGLTERLLTHFSLPIPFPPATCGRRNSASDRNPAKSRWGGSCTATPHGLPQHHLGSATMKHPQASASGRFFIPTAEHSLLYYCSLLCLSSWRSAKMAKRIQKDLPIFCPAVAMYRDDLDAIICVMVDASGGVKISDKEYEYESLDELARLRGKSADVVNIRSDANEQSGWSSIRLSIDRKQVHLSAPDNESGRSLYHKIRDILDSRRRWYCALPVRIPDKISSVWWVFAVVMPLAPWIVAICLGPLVGRSISFRRPALALAYGLLTGYLVL